MIETDFIQHNKPNVCIRETLKDKHDIVHTILLLFFTQIFINHKPSWKNRRQQWRIGAKQ